MESFLYVALDLALFFVSPTLYDLPKNLTESSAAVVILLFAIDLERFED